MELNRKGKGSNARKVINEEGASVLARVPEVQLYLEASNLKIKSDEFYKTADENLSKLIDGARKADPKYVYGLSRFLTDNGLKLSPVVLYSVLSEKGISFNPENSALRGVPLGDGALRTFNTPQRIAEAIGLVKGKHIKKLNNSFKVHVLRNSLQTMGQFTLRKNKMSTRQIKLKDLIKLLRPNPKIHGPEADDYAALYKAIIEETKLSKMTEDTLIRVKSNKELSDKEKQEYFQKNIDKIAVNELIRNLRFITDKFDFEREVELKRKVIAKLNGIKNHRFLNIFDIIETCMHVPELESALFEVIKNFTSEVKKKFNYHADATALFDVSGSMDGKGEELGFKYMVLLAMIFDNIKVYPFGDDLYPADPKMISTIRDGKLSKAFGLYKNRNQGTALVRSAEELLDKEKEIKNLIVVSDEVSWKEGEQMDHGIKSLASKLKDKTLILVNPTISVGTTFDTNVVAMGSLTSAVLYNVMLATNQKAFIEMIKEYE
jgi:hypothetical protein